MLGSIFSRTPKDLSLATLEGNRNPGWRAIRRARKLARSIIEAAASRQEIVARRTDIDREFALPGANWDLVTSDYTHAFKMMSSLEWDVWRKLRIYSQSFSGNSLIKMDIGLGTSVRDPTPPQFEKRWPDERRDAYVRHWRKLMEPQWCGFVYSPPNMLGEVGWWLDGILLNVDSIAYQERLNFIYMSQVFDRLKTKKPRILEIGGGYGALCAALCANLDVAQYVICDLPESLIFSGPYLAMAQSRPVRLIAEREKAAIRAAGEVCLLPNYLAQPALDGEAFDLVINTLSLSEMTAHQISIYGALISKAIGSHGFFFEQNHDNSHEGLLDCREFLKPHFTHKVEIEQGDMPATRGSVFTWSNT